MVKMMVARSPASIKRSSVVNPTPKNRNKRNINPPVIPVKKAILVLVMLLRFISLGILIRGINKLNVTVFNILARIVFLRSHD